MIDDPTIDSWLREVGGSASTQLTDDVRTVLGEMEERAREHRFPIVGPQVGRLLYQLTCLRGARRIFELGSGFGYSTLWFAAAMQRGGEIHHTDGDAQNSADARAYLDRAGLSDDVQFHVGDAVEALQATKGEFDMVFMDIDKHGYPSAYEKFADRVRLGGIVIVDNLVWSGRIASGATDPASEGIRRYIDLMWGDPRYLSSLMPVRDGVGVSVRIQ